MRAMTIGTLAKQAGVGIDTVRYYERHGLIQTPQRSAAGYREYSVDDVSRLRFIRRAKELGFTLQEIGELLSLTQQREDGVAGVKGAAQTKLELVSQRIAELQRIRSGLRKLIDACPGHGPLDECPILAALTGDDHA